MLAQRPIKRKKSRGERKRNNCAKDITPKDTTKEVATPATQEIPKTENTQEQTEQTQKKN